jgi:hypothetical protein
MNTGALVLLDEEGARWWATQDRSGEEAGTPGQVIQVFCGSLKTGAEEGVRWLGSPGEEAWGESEQRLADWDRELAALAPIPAEAPLQDPIRELLSGDLATPALISLAQLPQWADALAGLSPISLPVGQAFRPPRFSRLGDLPLLVLGAVLAASGQEVRVLPLVPPRPTSPHIASEGWNGAAQPGAVLLTLGKLRHPEWPLVHLEALGLPVVLLEPEGAAPLPDLFSDAPRWRCHPHLGEGHLSPSTLPVCPAGGAGAPARAWLEVLRQWSPLTLEAEGQSRERQRLDRLIWQRLDPLPALTLVPEENDLMVERVLTQVRRAGLPHAVMHHTAEVLPSGSPLRWQRHLEAGESRLVPLRSQREAAGEVLGLDPVRAHLLEALELEATLAWPETHAVGWIHYPLLQQSLVPLADPLTYWQAVDTVQEALAELGMSLLLARKPPLEPGGLRDAQAQGLRSTLPCRPLPSLLAESQVVIAPGHIGTAHLEAMARGRAVVLLSPARLRRPSLLLGDPNLPLPRLSPEAFVPWWREQTRASLDHLAQAQAEWLRQQLMTTASVAGWLREIGVSLEARSQRFLGSGLMAQRPLLERAEQVDRLARRLQSLRSSPPGRLLQALRRGGRRS